MCSPAARRIGIAIAASDAVGNCCALRKLVHVRWQASTTPGHQPCARARNDGASRLDPWHVRLELRIFGLRTSGHVFTGLPTRINTLNRFMQSIAR
jgi:hypothetical protein